MIFFLHKLPASPPQSSKLYRERKQQTTSVCLNDYFAARAHVSIDLLLVDQTLALQHWLGLNARTPLPEPDLKIQPPIWFEFSLWTVGFGIPEGSPTES
jgi:hypothetical protein